MNAMLMAHSTKKNPKWYEPKDFIPDYLSEEKEEKKKAQTVDEMRDILKAIAGIRK